MPNGIYPGGTSIPFLSAPSPSYDPTYKLKGVLHTTESVDYDPSQYSYYGHNNPPHFTVAKKGQGAKVYQHFSVNNGSRALANEPGGVETNRGGAVQIEIAWRAANIANLPQPMKDELRKLIAWISSTMGIQKTSPTFYGSSEGYGSGAASRMSFAEWKAFNGWCGHQHVPENVHWDPGLIDIKYLLKGGGN